MDSPAPDVAAPSEEVVFASENGALVCRFGGETLRIEPWGADALRVRARPGREVVAPHVSALLPPAPGTARVEIRAREATITRGRLTARARLVGRIGADVKRELVLSFHDADGRELLAETRPHFAGPRTRNFKGLASGSWRLEAHFRAYDGERLTGLGQPRTAGSPSRAWRRRWCSRTRMW